MLIISFSYLRQRFSCRQVINFNIIRLWNLHFPSLFLVQLSVTLGRPPSFLQSFPLSFRIPLSSVHFLQAQILVWRNKRESLLKIWFAWQGISKSMKDRAQEQDLTDDILHSVFRTNKSPGEKFITLDWTRSIDIGMLLQPDWTSLAV